jgi:uncharacterized membrane protein
VRLAIIYEIIALLITGYMSYHKFMGGALTCTVGGAFNCDIVENSLWSTITFPAQIILPTAFVGFLWHVIILGLYLLEPRIPFLRTWGKTIILAVVLFGFLYHCYLTFFISIGTLRALCIYCLSAHTLMAGQLVISFLRLRRDWSASEPAAA